MGIKLWARLKFSSQLYCPALVFVEVDLPCMCKPCMFEWNTCVYFEFIPSLFFSFCLRPSCLSPVSVGFKAENERHRLQISPWLPAPVQEIDTFPAAFVELCYLLALNQLLSHTLIFRNKGWYTISRPRQTESQTLKTIWRLIQSSCFPWKRNLLLSLSEIEPRYLIRPWQKAVLIFPKS